jgi:hypothetical protein
LHVGTGRLDVEQVFAWKKMRNHNAWHILQLPKPRTSQIELWLNSLWIFLQSVTSHWEFWHTAACITGVCRSFNYIFRKENNMEMHITKRFFKMKTEMAYVFYIDYQRTVILIRIFGFGCVSVSDHCYIFPIWIKQQSWLDFSYYHFFLWERKKTILNFQ